MCNFTHKVSNAQDRTGDPRAVENRRHLCFYVSILRALTLLLVVSCGCSSVNFLGQNTNMNVISVWILSFSSFPLITKTHIVYPDIYPCTYTECYCPKSDFPPNIHAADYYFSLYCCGPPTISCLKLCFQWSHQTANINPDLFERPSTCNTVSLLWSLGKYDQWISSFPITLRSPWIIFTHAPRWPCGQSNKAVNFEMLWERAEYFCHSLA